MAGKLHKAIIILGTFMVVFIGCAGERAYSATVKMSVFDRFRHEMTLSQEAATAKFMAPNALAKWNRDIKPYFKKYDQRLSHFFAYSMFVAKKKNSDLFLIFFNPWVDGALFTQWKKESETWKLENFYLASGERVRGEVTPQSTIRRSQILPVWQWYRGLFLRNIISYYKDMRARLTVKNIDEYLSWYSLSEGEKKADLLRVMLRMGTRVKLTDGYTAKDKSRPTLAGAFAILKYDALTGNKMKLASYSRHADILVDMRPEIIKTFRKNWVFKKNNIYTAILSSAIFPRSFILMNITAAGKIEGAFFCDLESLATMLQPKASTAGKAISKQRAAPIQSIREVNRYKAITGEVVEIITEKKDGKTIKITIVNGKVMEILTF